MNLIDMILSEKRHIRAQLYEIYMKSEILNLLWLEVCSVVILGWCYWLMGNLGSLLEVLETFYILIVVLITQKYMSICEDSQANTHEICVLYCKVYLNQEEKLMVVNSNKT